MIDEDETLRRFGYKSCELSPKSGKKVVYECQRCHTRVETVKHAVPAQGRCRKCAVTDPAFITQRAETCRKTWAVKTQTNSAYTQYVDRDETQKRFGYDPDTLSPMSNKRVVYRCAGCSGFVETPKSSIRDGQRCRTCSYRNPEHNKNRLTNAQKIRDEARYPVPDWIDAEETLRRFGYAADQVSAGSRKKIVYRCVGCKQQVQTARHNIHTNEPKCRVCTKNNPEVQARIVAGLRATWDSRRAEIISKRDATLVERYGSVDQGRRRASDKSVATRIALYGTAFGPVTPNSYGKTENDVAQFFTDRGFAMERQVVLPGERKSLDIVVPAAKLAVEYCGLYWHTEESPTPRPAGYHLNKHDAAIRAGLRLVTVFEDEWLDHRHAVEGVLEAALGVYAIKTAARKCRLVAETDPRAVDAFLDAEHLQGSPRRAVAAWSLFLGEDRVACMTLAPHHRTGTDLVLDRFCVKRGVRIVGGARRLFAALCNEARRRGATRVLSWSDRRWFGGGVYRALGFVEDGVLPPDYSYVDTRRPGTRLSKQSQKKANTGCPADVTERDWALQHGLARIWDCGKVRWVFAL